MSSSPSEFPAEPLDEVEPTRCPSLNRRDDFIAEIHEVADKLARDEAPLGDVKLLARAMKELRYAFKVFGKYRAHRKVSVFGSARTPEDHPDFQLSEEFGRRMAARGWMVLTGAGNGIMEGAHRGAGPELSMGANIMLPFEQSANRVISGDPKLVTFRYFFTRKLIFVKEVHAIALFTGGFGTQDELFETLTLVQTGKRDPLPIVLVQRPGTTYWSRWMEYIREELHRPGWISPQDESLYRVVESAADAEAEIVRFYANYHSLRYVRDELYVRLQQAPTAELLDRLNTEFADLLTSGRFESAEPHHHEADEKHLHELSRLKFRFNRRDTGRLRQMIDVLNASATSDNPPA